MRVNNAPLNLCYNSRYFESRSLVRRIMNFMTSDPNSLSFFSLWALFSSLARASRPRMIACSKFLRKSFFEPKKLGLAKFRREKYSERSFYDTWFSRFIVLQRTSYLNGYTSQNNTPLDVQASQSLESLVV